MECHGRAQVLKPAGRLVVAVQSDLTAAGQAYGLLPACMPWDEQDLAQAFMEARARARALPSLCPPHPRLRRESL
jgi:hypothetical protein